MYSPSLGMRLGVWCEKKTDADRWNASCTMLVYPTDASRLRLPVPILYDKLLDVDRESSPLLSRILILLFKREWLSGNGEFT